MTQQLIVPQTSAGVFDTVLQADQAIRQLLAAGFSKEQLAVVCPVKFKDHFQIAVPQAETPSADTATALATGGAVGATLGGLALAATVMTSGLSAVAAAVFIGGGAIAGGFSNLIAAKGYEQEADDSHREAIERGQIVVGVEVAGEDGAARLAEAQRILDEAGGRQVLAV